MTNRTDDENGPSARGTVSEASTIGANPPLIYADALIGLAAGAFTSRMMLATQEGVGDNVKPALVVVMPTQALYGLALHIVRVLADTNGIEKTKAIHAAFASALADPEAAARSLNLDAHLD